MYPDKDGLFSSVSIGLVLFFLLSNSLTFFITQPIIHDASLMTQTRPVITKNALDSIAEDGKVSVIATGSSMTFKALDGKCVSELIESDAAIYNIAQLNSLPWNDMIHIPRIIKSNPEIVLIEIGPNLLRNVEPFHMEYSEFRYKLDTSMQNSNDYGDWVNLIDPRFEQFVALNDIQRMKLRQEYVPNAMEEHLSRFIENESSSRKEWTYGWTPRPDDLGWMEYLQTPIYPPDRWGFDGMSTEERKEYNETKMDDAEEFYRPELETQAFDALEYEISTLLENQINVIIVALPHHPDSLKYVSNEKWDSVNQTIEYFSNFDGVTVYNEIWGIGWEDEHFYDRNHLDDEGRIEFCQRLAPIIDQVLNE